MTNVQYIIIVLLLIERLQKPKSAEEMARLIDSRVIDKTDNIILKERLCKKQPFQKISYDTGYSVDGVKKRFYKAVKQAQIKIK